MLFAETAMKAFLLLGEDDDTVINEVRSRATKKFQHAKHLRAKKKYIFMIMFERAWIKRAACSTETVVYFFI